MRYGQCSTTETHVCSVDGQSYYDRLKQIAEDSADEDAEARQLSASAARDHPDKLALATAPGQNAERRTESRQRGAGTAANAAPYTLHKTAAAPNATSERTAGCTDHKAAANREAVGGTESAVGAAPAQPTELVAAANSKGNVASQAAAVVDGKAALAETPQRSNRTTGPGAAVRRRKTAATPVPRKPVDKLAESAPGDQSVEQTAFQNCLILSVQMRLEPPLEITGKRKRHVYQKASHATSG